MSQERNQGDPFTLFIVICGMVALGALGASKKFGNCPSTVAYDARMTEGLVILAQIAMLLGLSIVVGLFVMGRVSQSVGILHRPLLSLTGGGLIALGIYGANYLLRNYSGTATCVDGLFAGFPF